MDLRYLELPTNKLLKKFGSGNHKPGSGSATALQGMLSAQLILTVIDLSTEAKRKERYKDAQAELLRIDDVIKSRIYPRLEKLFNDDSIEFGKAIELRSARDQEKEPKIRKLLDEQSRKALVPATEIPIEIASLCLELGEFASFVFDNGFKSARGDSCVALTSASAALFGCLSIAELNLQKFNSNIWSQKIRSKINVLKTDYDALMTKAIKCHNDLEEENHDRLFNLEIENLRSERWSELRLSHVQIEKLAKDIQNVLWEYRDKIWDKDVPEGHIEVLNPQQAIEKLLGYKFEFAKLGRHINDDGTSIDVAGLIDKQNREVLVSEDFPVEVQNFTAAHELGHALLHKGMVLHRDRALDGSASDRDFREIQADKFAAFFLMPGKQVKVLFQDLFLTETFRITQDSVFQLGEGESVTAFKAKYRNLRGLSRFLSSTEYFKGKRFNCLAKVFKVSAGAMAIRLEELGLITFD